ncbi:MAG: tRNA threonylcarbamoyladenosine dehydratase [Gallionellales bacterium 35-53-114]|nr:MAG: tRNA threonylcarbamoyladenosine dehydratase [Gallionellales bacterium 35-53-114]OYZ63858.1 MAG: tRNA threonylcarbamoyladenosine dehydratase [Gallionellales bacterium 24-53-125]OZB09311.1 MAG: tRNA threonylcarbamoyladenosine dehydratase [Gallionellales bacterium 39-52-133]HQS59075.1 tRNA threonylcarbamoyladenosine dehydratase [Gallionellaceae bacterium]HQS75811.1 tRNA threonylcarbamoyladenosine dehydratase [Gallionellaceae bacterium]
MQNIPPQFSRTHILLGDAGLQHLASRHVFVAGLGGVGSYCVEALARAGIGRLTLLDHDVVAISNINRQLPALHSTVGQSKAELMRARVADINPDCKVTILKTFLTIDNVNQLVPADSDYVIDCIDSLSCKVALLAESLKRGLNVASSMGAGNKLDPSRIRVADISKTEVCPLARNIRLRLRRENIYKPLLTVYSDEAGSAPLPPQPVEGPGRARAVNGTISYMPALFGLMLAGAVLKRMLEQGSTTAQ